MKRFSTPLALVFHALCAMPALGGGSYIVESDPPGDAVIRRTDLGGDGSINPAVQRLPEMIEMRLGAFAPADPAADLFAGAWSESGAFLRFELVLSGLLNPPGPLGYDDEFPEFDPQRYGPNPIFGWLEFDLDVDAETGGELSYPQNRFVGAVARFGGLPADPRFAGRVAEDDEAFDDDVTTPPYVDRSGEEFHVALLGEEIEHVVVVQERFCGNPALFEVGEVWVIEGDLFHRAHGFEEFAQSCIGRWGRYEPAVFLRFAHDAPADRTTLSLVYPLTNAASAAMIGPCVLVEPNNGCDDDQNSIEEALVDLQSSAQLADPYDRMMPEFQLLAGWEFKTPADHLDTAAWRIAALTGTAYAAAQPDGARFIWTDVWPNPRAGDFNGDGLHTPADAAALCDYITQHDGVPGYDDDGDATNGQIAVSRFARNFTPYDSNGDGVVAASDVILDGDMDLDQQVSGDDVDDFVQALLDPNAYSAAHGGSDPTLRGDFNGDGGLDARDLQGFVSLLCGNELLVTTGDPR